ncbi:MAG: hypothetical protein ABII64_00045 [Elusimicrobiota bacterium]
MSVISARSLFADTMPDCTVMVQKKNQQTIKGWGCFPTYTCYWERADEFIKNDKIQSLIYDELGITVARFDLLPDFYDASKDDGSLNINSLEALIEKIIKPAQNHGIRQYFFSPWTPPLPFRKFNTWMPYGPNKELNNLKVEREDDYVRYIVEVLKYIRVKGVTLPIGVSIQNELKSMVEWQGCIYSREQYQRVAKKLRKALDANNLNKVLILGPEGALIDDNAEILGGFDLPDLKNDKELNRAIGAIAHHTYDQWQEGTKDPSLFKRYNNAAVNTGKDLWMTEWSVGVGGSEIEKVINTMRHVIRDLVLVRNNYYIWWLGWDFKNTEYALLVEGKGEDVKKTKLFYIFQKLFNNASPGCAVRHLTTDDPDLRANDAFYIDMVAFDSGKSMVVLLANYTTKDKKMLLKGLKGKKINEYQTTETEDMADRGVKDIINGSAEIILPQKSVVILVTHK